MKPILRWLCQLLLLLGLGSTAWAHKAGDAYLNISSAAAAAQTLEFRFVMALRDWDTADPGLDADDNRQLSWAEVQQARPRMQLRTAQDLDILCGNSKIALDWRFDGLEQRTDGVYTVLRAAGQCAADKPLAYAFRMLNGLDPTHRLLVAEQHNGRDSLTVIGAASSRTTTASEAGVDRAVVQSASSGTAVFWSFFDEGTGHLFAGYDHIAFLLALVLPLSLRRRTGDSTRSIGLTDIVAIVTCFTIGHSMTLVLVTLWGLAVPSMLVEPLIAISIAVSALMNLGWLRQWSRRWVAIGFGLIHGLGFSTSLQALDAGSNTTFWALAGFNVGVEAGQLALVMIWCAGIYLLDRFDVRRLWLVPVGSWCLFAAGIGLALQRIIA